jgi:hypothetical protein
MRTCIHAHNAYHTYTHTYTHASADTRTLRILLARVPLRVPPPLHAPLPPRPLLLSQPTPAPPTQTHATSSSSSHDGHSRLFAFGPAAAAAAARRRTPSSTGPCSARTGEARPKTHFKTIQAPGATTPAHTQLVGGEGQTGGEGHPKTHTSFGTIHAQQKIHKHTQTSLNSTQAHAKGLDSASGIGGLRRAHWGGPSGGDRWAG